MGIQRKHHVEVSAEKHNTSNSFRASGLGPVIVRKNCRECKLSFGQEQFWFLEQMDPENAAYNIFIAQRLFGQLDTNALAKAFSEIVCRHEALRTHFDVLDGEPIQRVDPPPEAVLSIEFLRRANPDDREMELQRIAEDEAITPFDLTRSPLLRARLLQLGENDHALLLTTHHIVSDGWSISLLMKELELLYTAFTESRPSPLPALSIQYSDYVLWQRDWLSNEAHDEHYRYWRGQLENSSHLALPTDFPRPPVRRSRGATEMFSAPKDTTDRLQAIAQREGATLFTALVAAFQVVLGFWTNQESITIGTGVINRIRKELEDLIGLFVNTLALRTNLGGNPSFRELLGRVRKVTLDAYKYQDLPFERLVEKLAPERSLNRNPIFDVLFGFNKISSYELTLPGIVASPMQVPLTRSKFDLTLVFNEKNGWINGALTYSNDLFEAATIRRLIGHILRALDCAADDVDQRIGNWNLLTDTESRQLLVEWNQTSLSYPRSRCFHELFEDQALSTPDAIAVVCGERMLSYDELNSRADQLTAKLIRLGVSRETRVALCLDRSVELAVGILSILKAGGVYVPLDPEYPRERLEWMLQDSKAAIVLTQESLRDRIPQVGHPIICLDHFSDSFVQHTKSYLRPHVFPENLAFIIYTSGSTGRPKGVMVQHQSLINTLMHSLRAFGFTGKDIWAALASFSFDISLLELMTPWLGGGASLILGREDILDMNLLAKRLEAATSFLAVPSLMRHIIGQLSERPNKNRWPGLKRVFTGGERVDPSLIQDIQRVFPESEVIVLYGPTEATLICAGEPIGYSIDIGKPLIGRPIANTQIYIIDKHMRPVPVGVYGELYIGGAGVARGYMNRPDLTAERFVPDPFSNYPGARLYCTGDLGRYDYDGIIEFFGRCDEQIKIRGYRIEPAEIDNILSEWSGVKACVTVAHELKNEDIQLVSYVVSGSDVEMTRIWEFLRKKLPAYMIPSAIIPIEKIPITANGKLDRKALPAPSVERPRATHVSAQTPVEKKIVAIWSAILGIHQIGIDDNFFELGGHSLSLARLRDALCREFGCNLSMVEMFKFPTVQAMARQIGDSTVMIKDAAEMRDQVLAGRDRVKLLRRRRSTPRPS